MRQSLYTICAVLFFTLGVLLFSGNYVSSETSGNTPADKKDVVYEVPADMEEKWGDMVKVLLDEYDVCLEHCAGDADCEKRCRQAYKARLERTHAQLMEESNLGSGAGTRKKQ